MALKLALKVVLTSTAIYYTNKYEVWEPLSRNNRNYDDLLNDANVLIKQNTPEALKSNIPNVVNQDLCAKTTYYYNKGVLNTFEFISNLPSNACNLYKDAVKKLEQTTNNVK